MNESSITVEAYLAGELVSATKHEYLGGMVYAMSGASNQHNLVATNITVALGSRLKTRRCRPFNSDTKIRVLLSNQIRFYYPDISVICRPNSPSDSFQDEPAVIFEVLSPATRRIDEGEKKDAYLAIPSLSIYALVEQDSALVIVYRRTAQGFAREEYEGLGAVIPLTEIETELPLADIYEGVDFSHETDPDPE